MDDSGERVVEMERVSSPSIFFVLFPAIWCFVGVLILTLLPQLVGAYNYLRGAPSPIDQTILALLGSDLSRLVVLTSSIIGMLTGLYLSHLVTTKLDRLKKEGAAQLSLRICLLLLWWWSIPLMLLSLLSINSRFLSDVCVFTMAAYFITFSIPILLKYVNALMYARTLDSRIMLVQRPRRSGLKKPVYYLTLRAAHERLDP